MPVQFSQIPANLRLPGIFIEVDPSKASRSDDPGRILLVGQKLAAGTAAANVPVPVTSVDDAKLQFGVGSMLAAMMDALRQADPFGLIWALPMADAGGGVAATGTITVNTAPTAPGVIPLYVAGVKVPVAVAGTETTTTAATAIAAAINANADLPVTAAAVAAVVTLTARNKGTLGNDIDVRYAWLGNAGGEALPTGYTGAIVAMANGATDPDIMAGLAALGDTTFDFIVMPYTDAGNLTAASSAMNDTTGRWAFNRMLWGHVFTAKRGTVSSLTTFGLGRNDPHITVRGFNLSPTPVWRWIAATQGAEAVALRNDPARPTQTIAVPGLLAPPLGSTGRFTQAERQTLLSTGISTTTYDADGTVRLERTISTYQLNGTGQPDEAWLSVEKTFTLMRVHRRLRAALSAKYQRAKIANDGTRSALGNGVITPSIARADVIAEMRNMEGDGLLDNVDGVLAQVLVERDPQNPDRLNVLFPPPLIGQGRIFAVLSQFRVLNT
jgi:phage tail sheath gpL-like